MEKLFEIYGLQTPCTVFSCQHFFQINTSQLSVCVTSGAKFWFKKFFFGKAISTIGADVN
jgi:hypothetical protein